MRTTVNIDDDLLRRARLSAAHRHTTLGELVQEALRRMLAGVKPGDKAKSPIDLPESGGGGLHAGVDIDSSADLLMVMENRDDSYGR